MYKPLDLQEQHELNVAFAAYVAVDEPDWAMFEHAADQAVRDADRRSRACSASAHAPTPSAAPPLTGPAPPPPAASRPDLEQLIRMHAQGMSVTAISRAGGMSATAARRALITNGQARRRLAVG